MAFTAELTCPGTTGNRIIIKTDLDLNAGGLNALVELLPPCSWAHSIPQAMVSITWLSSLAITSITTSPRRSDQYLRRV